MAQVVTSLSSRRPMRRGIHTGSLGCGERKREEIFEEWK
jgi:hypothetical protein